MYVEEVKNTINNLKLNSSMNTRIMYTLKKRHNWTYEFRAYNDFTILISNVEDFIH